MVYEIEKHMLTAIDQEFFKKIKKMLDYYILKKEEISFQF